MPEDLSGAVEKLAGISRTIRRDRELAFYGAEDPTPSGFYSGDDASEARRGAQVTVALVEPHVKGA